MCYCHVILLTPTQICISIGALVVVLGWPALLGIVVMGSTIPISTFLGRWTASVQEALMNSTDKRVNIMSEV